MSTFFLANNRRRSSKFSFAKSPRFATPYKVTDSFASTDGSTFISKTRNPSPFNTTQTRFGKHVKLDPLIKSSDSKMGKVSGVYEVSMEKEAPIETKISYTFGTSRKSIKPIWVDKIIDDGSKLRA